MTVRGMLRACGLKECDIKLLSLTESNLNERFEVWTAKRSRENKIERALHIPGFLDEFGIVLVRIKG